MTNYSFPTSLPAYHEGPDIKRRQQDELLAFIVKGAADNLLHLARLTGLPQSTVSGRINDLIEESKVKYLGYTVYADRKRKKIIAINPVRTGQQQQLFTI
jgi:hypothetical protein